MVLCLLQPDLVQAKHLHWLKELFILYKNVVLSLSKL